MRSNNKKQSGAPPEQYDVLPDDLLRNIARLKGHAPRKGVPVDASILYPVSAAIRKAGEEALINATPGQEIPGYGVFIGTWQPEDHDGNSLCQKFNVFAAPEDLKDDNGERALLTYDDTLAHISNLRNWNGHNGEAYKDDTELYAALEDGSYKGGWVIPPRELLIGVKADDPCIGYGGDRIVHPDNLYTHKNAGSLKGTFCLHAETSNVAFKGWYWTSTEYLNWGQMNTACLESCNVGPDSKDRRLSCRPIRLEEARLELAP